jgi:hypothetical protein
MKTGIFPQLHLLPTSDTLYVSFGFWGTYAYKKPFVCTSTYKNGPGKMDARTSEHLFASTKFL